MTKLLKCDIILSSLEEETKVDALFSYGTLKICYIGKETSEEDKKLLLKEASVLEQSIERRKKLLSNEKYVQNAPEKIVESERQKLQEEEEKLNNINSKLN